MKLYVKSVKMDQVEFTMPHQSGGGHWCSSGYRSQGVMKYFAPEDNEAIEYLKQKGISFDLIDLSDCSFKTRLQAKMSGIGLTPTLILNDGTRINGIEQVKKERF
jgi:hypothetical protein